MSQYPEERANIARVKEHLSEYVAKVEQGQKVIVCRRNGPVAELIQTRHHATPNRTRLGTAPGSVQTKCDLTDAVMSTDEWGSLP